jgi:hypothetical protein
MGCGQVVMGRVRTAINLRQANATDYEAQLRMSYRSIAETVPRQIMAEALLAAFRSSDLGLAKLVEELFKHCDPKAQVELLSIVLEPLAARFRERLVCAGLSACGEQGARPSAGGDESVESLGLMAAEAARLDPVLVERVSDFCSRAPNITENLPTPVLVAALAGMVRFSQREGPTCLDPEI